MQQKINSLGCPPIQLIDTLSPKIISEADIITNSGHLRPLDQDKLQYLKKGAVASLMYEDWEIRDIDIDINYCNRQNIVVGAINERHQNATSPALLRGLEKIAKGGWTPVDITGREEGYFLYPEFRDFRAFYRRGCKLMAP